MVRDSIVPKLRAVLVIGYITLYVELGNKGQGLVSVPTY